MADRFIGIRKAIRIGFFIKTLGYVLLVVPTGGILFTLEVSFCC